MPNFFNESPEIADGAPWRGGVRVSGESLRFLESVPCWLDLLCREFVKTAASETEAEHFAARVSRLVSDRRDFESVELRFMLARIQSCEYGLAYLIAGLEGEKSPYFFAFQRLSFALTLKLNHIDGANGQYRSAVANLLKVASEPDRSMLAAGAPMSFVLVHIGGVWAAKMGGAELEVERRQAVAEAHRAARDDLLMVLGAS